MEGGGRGREGQIFQRLLLASGTDALQTLKPLEEKCNSELLI